MAPRDIALVLIYCYLELYSFTVLLLKLSSMIILIGRLAQPHVISAKTIENMLNPARASNENKLSKGFCCAITIVPI